MNVVISLFWLKRSEKIWEKWLYDETINEIVLVQHL